MTIKSVVAEFASRLSQLVESHAMERARAAVMSAFGSPPRRGPGRPPKSASAPKQLVAKAAVLENGKPGKVQPKKARKKAPLQLCPVPGCKNPAAPVFGMVCSKHKDLPKAKIKKFREARKAKKLGLAAPKAKRRVAKKVAPKQVVAKKAAPKSVAKAKKKAAQRKAPKAPAMAAAPMMPAATPSASASAEG